MEQYTQPIVKAFGNGRLCFLDEGDCGRAARQQGGLPRRSVVFLGSSRVFWMCEFLLFLDLKEKVRLLIDLGIFRKNRGNASENPIVRLPRLTSGRPLVMRKIVCVFLCFM